METETKLPDNVEMFLWKGQKRYRCPGHWESGAKCQYDTSDPNMLVKHMASPHLRAVPTEAGTPPAPTAAPVPATVADTEAQAPEFKLARFADRRAETEE